MINMAKLFLLQAYLLFFTTIPLWSQRHMEWLDRGLVAVRLDENRVFLSWRYLAEDLPSKGFNIYKEGKLINQLPITASTNFIDTNASENATYYVRKEEDSFKQVSSKNVAVLSAPYVEIPLHEGNYHVQHAWPGDLNGNGSFDYVLSRLPLSSGSPVVEAYLNDGTFLWRMDMGPNSVSRLSSFGENDPPSASISGFGNVAGFRDNDNITVYDLNCDGKAEVLVRTAAGVIFGDDKILNHSNNYDQFISVIDGFSGEEITRTPLPGDFKNDGPMGGHFGIAYLNGEYPSLIVKLENRKTDRTFNLLIAAYDFVDRKLQLRWKWLRSDSVNAYNFHQIRIADVNGDGKDDICDGNYVINSDGKFLYAVEGAIHGDRFHITDMDPGRPGLEGYAIQQTEGKQTAAFPWYYYDAETGEIIFKGDILQDVGRGTVADINPDYKGYEMYAADGVYSVGKTMLSSSMPVVNLRIWWDGDLLSELLDKTYIEKWNHNLQTSQKLFEASGVIYAARNVPPFYGDVFGDWREEVMWETDDHKSIRIYTTTGLTGYKIYALAQNPEYRACLTTKGYYQSNLVDYYLGAGMSSEQPPEIIYNNSQTCDPDISPWEKINIGTNYDYNCCRFVDDELIIEASGKGFTGVSDQFFFMYQTGSDIETIITKVDTLDSTDSLALTGLMCRSDLSQNAPFYSCGYSSHYGLFIAARPGKNISSSFLKIPVGISLPIWLRITKTHHTFTSYYSPDNHQWHQIGSTDIPTDTLSYTGVAAASGGNETSTFNLSSLSLIDTYTGLPDFEKDDNRSADNLCLALYPNPVSDILYLDYQESAGNPDHFTVNIYDLSEKLHISQTISDSQHIFLDISNLQSGMYILKTTDKEGNHYRSKFLKP